MKTEKFFIQGVLIFALLLGLIITPLVGNAQATNSQVESNKNSQVELNLGKFYADATREILANTLGITVDELYSLRASGKSIEQIGKEKGISKAEITKALTKEMTKKIEQLFKEGKISTDQKNRLLNDLEEKLEYRLDRTNIGDRNQKGDRRFNQDSSRTKENN
ncbi:MAG: hypothetical protein AB7V16_04985 [Vulcanibacillus sp.]